MKLLVPVGTADQRSRWSARHGDPPNFLSIPRVGRQTWEVPETQNNPETLAASSL